MKRTPLTSLFASPAPARLLAGLRESRRVLLIAALLCVGGVMFLVGRNTVAVPEHWLADVKALQMEIRQQQGKVDRLRRENDQGTKALAARLAELQAASTRLDALGERLAHMGQLTLDEFDFSEPAPVGGPAAELSSGNAGQLELAHAIDTLSVRLHRQASQLDALQFLMVNRQLEDDFTPKGWPVSKGWISSRYGERNDPFTGDRELHGGLDFAGTRGTEVLSVASGVVIWAASRTGYGKTIEIDHGNGYRTRYAHGDELTVEVGDHVSAGQVIALMGSTGRSSAPHVHFEVLKDGSRINPSRFVGSLR